MKKMKNPNFVTFIIVCGLSAVLAIPNAEGRSSSLKKAPAQTSTASQSEGFFGTFSTPQELKEKRKTAKESAMKSSPKVVQSPSVSEEKSEKNGWNPFSGLFGKKKSENDVPLPSENAVPHSDLSVSANTPEMMPENSLAIPSPENEIIPEADEGSVPQTEGFTADSPQIVLDSSEPAPAVNPVLASVPEAPVPEAPVSANSPQMESVPVQEPVIQTAEVKPQTQLKTEENVLREITPAPQTPAVVNESYAEIPVKMPVIPQSVPREQMDSMAENPEAEVSISELHISESGDLVSQDSDSGIPELEFMESAQKTPILNVSPQRLVSPSIDQMGGSRPEFTGENSVSSMDSIPGMKEAGINQRFGHEVSMGDSSKIRAELKTLTRIPENLLVGVQTEIEVEILNASTVSSEGSVVEIAIPDWFQVLKMVPGKGEVNFTPSEGSAGQHCVWNVGTVLPNAREKLLLYVIPEKKNAANIQVSWSNRQFAEHQTIVSEEPEIQLRMLGSTNIQKGKEAQLNILVRNTGTCTVHEIAIICEATGCQNQKYFIPGIQTLLPGEEKSVELNITPVSRDGANLHVEAFIKNRCFCKTDYDLNVNYVDFQIQTPELEKCVVGMDLHLPLVISNEGNTLAEGCKLCVELPPQLRFTGETLDQIEKDPLTGLTTLRLDEMAPGEKRNLMLNLHCMEEGQTELPLGILLKSRTITEKKIPLILEGIASVEMKLLLPQRVLTCSETCDYEIQIENSGNRKIDDGKLVVYFSDGFEPVSTNQGGEIQSDGIVTFNIPVLVPGESQTFRLQAESVIPGNHVIRCELKSNVHQLNLMQQETVIFR